MNTVFSKVLLASLLTAALAGCSDSSGPADSGSSGGTSNTGGSDNSGNTGNTGGGTGSSSGGNTVTSLVKNGIMANLGGSEQWYLMASDFTGRATGPFGAAPTHRRVEFKPSAGETSQTLENGMRAVRLRFWAPLTPGVTNCGSDSTIATDFFYDVGEEITTVTGSYVGTKTYTATDCSIRMDYVSASGGLEGEIVSATFSNSAGNTVQIANAPFRVFQHKGTDGTLSTVPDNAYAVLNIDSGSFELAASQHFGFSYRDPMYIISNHADTPATVALITDDGMENGTIKFNMPDVTDCTTTSVELGYYAGLTSNILEYAVDPSSCSAQIVLQGGDTSQYKVVDYTATLKAADAILVDADETVTVSGQIRNFATAQVLVDVTADQSALGSSAGSATLQITDGSAHFATGDTFSANLSLEALKTYDFSGFSYRRIVINRPERTGQTAGFGLTIHTPLGTIPETFNCGPDPSGASYGTKMELGTQGMAYVADSCTVTLTAVSNTEISGTFEATLTIPGASGVMPGGDNTITISGTFVNTQ